MFNFKSITKKHMNPKESIIYMAQCQIEKNLIYIGKTHQTFNERVEQHNSSARNADSTPFHKALVDYGIINWDWSILERCTVDEEYMKEKEWIKKLGAMSVDLLNDTHKNKISNNSNNKFSNKITDKTRGNNVHSYKKSELGIHFLRASGKIKPVINLKTKKVYNSQTKAAEKENITVATIKLCCKTGKMLSDGTRYANLDMNDSPILVEGHNKDNYVSKKRRIKNLVNNKTYNSVSDVVKEYKISKSCADGAARGTYMTVKNEWVFCFLDENGKEILTENHKKGLKKINEKNITKYVAWHIDDVDMKHLRYFKTLKGLCDSLEIKNKSHIKSVCEGKRHHAENWRVAYFDNVDKQPILKEKHKEKVRKRLRKITCLNDKKTFSSGIEAGRYYGINSGSITQCADGYSKSVYKGKERLRFAFLNEDGQPILKEKQRESLSQKGKKRIKLLKTGEEYQSLAEYCRETGVGRKRAKKYLDNPSIDLLGYEFIEIE